MIPVPMILFQCVDFIMYFIYMFGVMLIFAILCMYYVDASRRASYCGSSGSADRSC
jgi:hypothetical protein